MLNHVHKLDKTKFKINQEKNKESYWKSVTMCIIITYQELYYFQQGKFGDHHQ